MSYLIQKERVTGTPYPPIKELVLKKWHSAVTAFGFNVTVSRLMQDIFMHSNAATITNALNQMQLTRLMFSSVAGEPSWRASLSLSLALAHSFPNCKRNQGFGSRLIGTDDHGIYRTEALKEHPPAMCKALAQAFLASTPTSADAGQDDQIPAEVMARCK